MYVAHPVPCCVITIAQGNPFVELDGGAVVNLQNGYRHDQFPSSSGRVALASVIESPINSTRPRSSPSPDDRRHTATTIATLTQRLHISNQAFPLSVHFFHILPPTLFCLVEARPCSTRPSEQGVVSFLHLQ